MKYQNTSFSDHNAPVFLPLKFNPLSFETAEPEQEETTLSNVVTLDCSTHLHSPHKPINALCQSDGLYLGIVQV